MRVPGSELGDGSSSLRVCYIYEPIISISRQDSVRIAQQSVICLRFLSIRVPPVEVLLLLLSSHIAKPMNDGETCLKGLLSCLLTAGGQGPPVAPSNGPGGGPNAYQVLLCMLVGCDASQRSR